MKKLVIITNVFFIISLMEIQLAMGQDKTEDANLSGKKFTIENCVSEYSVDQSDETKSGHRFWFADKNFIDGRTLKLSAVKPNSATHPPHTHTEDEFFFILDGKAQFYLNGKTKVVGPYTSLYCPANSEHGISNAGDTELKYLVIKKYLK